jgi:hypothetical protein
MYFDKSQTDGYFAVSWFIFKKYKNSQCVTFTPLVHNIESLESE